MNFAPGQAKLAQKYWRIFLKVIKALTPNRILGVVAGSVLSLIVLPVHTDLLAKTAAEATATEAQPSSESTSATRQKLEAQFGAGIYQPLTERLQEVNRDIQSRGLHEYPGSKDKLLTGYAYGEYYDWDLYFENIYLSYYGVSKYNFSNLKIFLAQQQPDGFISRTLGIVNKRPTQMFKPFLAQLTVLGAQQNGNDYEWLRAGGYERLQKYVDRWFAYDSDGNGLPVWNSSDASGMDNQFSRSGQVESYTDEGVDLACYLLRELQAMAIISKSLGRPDDEKMYLDHAKRLTTLINTVFWDEKDGFYYDRNEKTGKPIHIKSVAGFFPLWVGVASPAQARALINKHLLNPKEFWLKYPVATYAKTEPDFYEGSQREECNWRGDTWIPSNYMIFHGLMRYGYDRVAKELATKTLDLALKANPATREYYNSDTGSGNGMNPFWGWSSLAYVMPLEYQLRYDPTDLHGAIRPIVSDAFGIQFDSSKPPTAAKVE
jgi:putative isomerase